MAIMKDSVTVIIPTLNEEANICEIIEELKRTGYSNIMVMDGNSSDGTVEVARKLGATVLSQKGQGKGAALIEAFGNCDGVDGEVFVMMDADGSMSPKEIQLFLEAMDSGADVVKGSRFLRGGGTQDMNLTRRLGNEFFLKLVNLFWSARYTDLCYGFAAFRKSALLKLYPFLTSKNFDIEAEIYVKSKKLDLRVKEVPSLEFRRRYGKSNLQIVPTGFRILKTIAKEFLDTYRR